MDIKFPFIFGELIKEKYRFDTVFAREWVIYEGLPESEADNRRKKVKLLKSGKQHPTDEDIIEFCELFDCTPDYLLGFSDTLHHETKDLQALTGLAPEACNKLLKWEKMKIGSPKRELSYLLEKRGFEEFLNELYRLRYEYRVYLQDNTFEYYNYDFEEDIFVLKENADIKKAVNELAELATHGKNNGKEYKVIQYDINQQVAEIIADIKKEVKTEWQNLQAEVFANAQTEDGKDE